jgi:hypothetical protein
LISFWKLRVGYKIHKEYELIKAEANVGKGREGIVEGRRERRQFVLNYQRHLDLVLMPRLRPRLMGAIKNRRTGRLVIH